MIWKITTCALALFCWNAQEKDIGSICCSWPLWTWAQRRLKCSCILTALMFCSSFETFRCCFFLRGLLQQSENRPSDGPGASGNVRLKCNVVVRAPLPFSDSPLFFQPIQLQNRHCGWSVRELTLTGCSAYGWVHEKRVSSYGRRQHCSQQCGHVEWRNWRSTDNPARKSSFWILPKNTCWYVWFFPIFFNVHGLLISLVVWLTYHHPTLLWQVSHTGTDCTSWPAVGRFVFAACSCSNLFDQTVTKSTRKPFIASGSSRRFDVEELFNCSAVFVCWSVQTCTEVLKVPSCMVVQRHIYFLDDDIMM